MLHTKINKNVKKDLNTEDKNRSMVLDKSKLILTAIVVCEEFLLLQWRKEKS